MFEPLKFYCIMILQGSFNNNQTNSTEMSFRYPHMLNKSHLLMTIHDLVLQCLGNAFLFYTSYQIGFTHIGFSNISGFPTFESGVLRFVCIFLFFCLIFITVFPRRLSGTEFVCRPVRRGERTPAFFCSSCAVNSYIVSCRYHVPVTCFSVI